MKKRMGHKERLITYRIGANIVASMEGKLSAYKTLVWLIQSYGMTSTDVKALLGLKRDQIKNLREAKLKEFSKDDLIGYTAKIIAKNSELLRIADGEKKNT